MTVKACLCLCCAHWIFPSDLTVCFFFLVALLFPSHCHCKLVVGIAASLRLRVFALFCLPFCILLCVSQVDQCYPQHTAELAKSHQRSCGDECRARRTRSQPSCRQGAPEHIFANSCIHFLCCSYLVVRDRVLSCLISYFVLLAGEIALQKCKLGEETYAEKGGGGIVIDPLEAACHLFGLFLTFFFALRWLSCGQKLLIQVSNRWAATLLIWLKDSSSCRWEWVCVCVHVKFVLYSAGLEVGHLQAWLYGILRSACVCVCVLFSAVRIGMIMANQLSSGFQASTLPR